MDDTEVIEPTRSRVLLGTKGLVPAFEMAVEGINRELDHLAHVAQQVRSQPPSEDLTSMTPSGKQLSIETLQQALAIQANATSDMGQLLSQDLMDNLAEMGLPHYAEGERLVNMLAILGTAVHAVARTYIRGAGRTAVMIERFGGPTVEESVQRMTDTVATFIGRQNAVVEEMGVHKHMFSTKTKSELKLN